LTTAVINLKKMVKMLDVEEVISILSWEISGIIQTGKNIFRKMTIELVIQTFQAAGPII